MDFRFCKLWTDSLEVFNLDVSGNYAAHDSSGVIKVFQRILRKDWQIHVSWIKQG